MHNNAPKLIAILRGISCEEVAPVATLLYDAGFRYLEIPMNSPNALHSIAHLVDLFGTQAYCGAGTVVTEEQAAAVIKTGANLMVTPNTNAAIIDMAKKANMVCLPGALTPTEAFTALHAGADGVKLFPISSLGPGYVKQLRAVLPPEKSLYAVGGVTPANMHEYAAAGCDGFGIGSDLYKPGTTLDDLKTKADIFIEQYRQLFKLKINNQ